MATVDFARVTKRFGTTVAVDNFELHIADGEFVVLLGPSGCGKSTVLRLLAGLDVANEGTIAIDGRIVDDVEAKDRDLAMVFQSYALYPHMTVAGNIAFPLKPRRMTAEERDRRVRDAAQLLGLVDVLERKPAELSGGQRQRVALARAIVRQPKAFLMDEPLSNLDARLRAQTRAEIVDLHRRLGTTFVYVTHDQVEAMTMADRVVIIDRGRIQQIGPPQEVYDRPANLFVARFVGAPAMNIVAASLDTARRVINALDAELPAPAVLCDRFSARPSVPLQLGIRPEHLDAADVSARRALTLTVTLVEALGYEQLIHGTLDDGTVVVQRIASTGRGSTPPAVGARLRLTFAADDVHLFDPVTTERLDA